MTERYRQFKPENDTSRLQDDRSGQKTTFHGATKSVYVPRRLDGV